VKSTALYCAKIRYISEKEVWHWHVWGSVWNGLREIVLSPMQAGVTRTVWLFIWFITQSKASRTSAVSIYRCPGRVVLRTTISKIVRNPRSAWKVPYAYKNSPRFPRDRAPYWLKPWRRLQLSATSNFQSLFDRWALLCSREWGVKMKARYNSNWRCILDWIGLPALVVTCRVWWFSV
jgi:hypothetical protein